MTEINKPTKLETTMPRNPADVTVQIICSGETDIGKVQVYAAVMPPFALGIPRASVQMYCASRYCTGEARWWEATQLEINSIDLRPAKVVGDYFDYFLDVMSRARAGHVALPSCGIRIVVGHGYGAATGEPFLKCGTNLKFSEFNSVASVLTTIDVCNAPRAVRALKGGNFPANKKKVNRAFDQIDFGLACTKSSVTHMFRVGWDGQHNVTDRQDPSYAPDHYPGMTEKIGFPVISSLMAAVKAYTTSGDVGDLDTIFKDQYQSINTRYLYENNDSSPKSLKEPYCSLGAFAELIDAHVLTPNNSSLDCILYNRLKEWFITQELVMVLPIEESKIASKIVDHVINTVKTWHEQNPDCITKVYPESENAWSRLLAMLGMNRHRLMLTTLAEPEKGGTLILGHDQNENDDGEIFEAWATSFPALSATVNHVLSCAESGAIDNLSIPTLVTESDQ